MHIKKDNLRVKKIMLFIIIFSLLWLINQSFWYTANSWVTKCRTSDNIISWLKKIPSSNNLNSPDNWSITCTENPYFWTKTSNYINKDTSKSCNDLSVTNWFAKSIDCFNSSNVSKPCTSDWSWWTKYKLSCMYKFEKENIKLDTSSFNSFWIADWSQKNIKISFPFNQNNLKNETKKLKLTFKLKDNTSINWYTQLKNTKADSAVKIWGSYKTDNFTTWENRTLEYSLDSVIKLNSYLNWSESWLNFPYSIYNPTKLASDWVTNWFLFNTIKYDIEFNDWWKFEDFYVYNSANEINNTDINLNISPLYTTTFDWEQNWSWFIEWVTQNWSITITKNPAWWTPTSIIWLFLEKAWGILTTQRTIDDVFSWTWSINWWTKINFLQDWIKNFYSSLTWTNLPFETFFTTILWDIRNLFVNAYVQYEINWENVIYRTASLWWNKWQIVNWLKIYWSTNISKNKQENTSRAQLWDIKNLAWNITKSSLKRDIKKEAYNIIKNININNETDVTIAKEIWNILYYDLRNDTDKIITLNIDNLDNNKTTIVLGWNLYIKCNWVNCSSNWNNLPWIIILKDENWNGWKLYIDPDILKIDAAIYTDKSILNYNMFYHELSPNNGWTYDILKKQLYIHWSLFSENTIWWSRKTPLVCPFYLYSTPSFICDLDKAQKYDLSYLRLWIENKLHFSDYPIVIEYNSKLQLSPPPLFSE